VCQGVLKETNSHSGHSEFRHVHTVVPEHPLHAVQVCPVSREAFLEIIPIGEIQEFLFDSRDPSRNMEPIQTMLAFLPKPGAYHSSQSVFAIRQDPQIRVLSSTAAPENGLHPPLCIRIQVPHHGECLAAELRGLDARGDLSGMDSHPQGQNPNL
jgi:hypothetical protein